MEENKRGLLARLYALRAGISALAAECSALRGEDERVRRVNIRIEDNTAGLANYSSIVETSKKTYKSAKHDYNKAKREYDKKSFPLLVWTIAFLCFAAAAIYVYYMRLGAAENLFLYDIATGALGIGALYSAARALIINRKVKPLRRKMRHARELMRDSEIWISESERGAALVKDENRGLRDEKRDLGASRDSVSALSVPLAAMMREQLGKTFSGTLSESYYGELDFIICMIKEDVASDIPAALLAVDEKRRDGAVEEAVFLSHEKIKLALADDIAELSEIIDSSLSELENNLKDGTGALIGGIDKSRAAEFGGADAVRVQIDKTCSADAIRGALYDMKHLTSLELAADTDYILSRSK